MEEKKLCTKCGEYSLYFYKDKSRPDGLSNKCVSCSKKYREENKEYFKAHAKKYKEDNPGYFKKYNKSATAIESRKRRSAKCRAKYPKKYKARKIFNHAIESGKVIRPTFCDECGKHCRPEAHHLDYDKPLFVMFLCVTCHKEWHMKNEAINGV